MKKLILLSASVLALNAAVPMVNIYAQNTASDVLTLTQELKSELQVNFDEAVELYQASYPNSEMTDVDIHLHQETNQFIVRILGREGSTNYQLIRYNGENYFASRDRQDDDDDLPINFEELAALDLVTQNAMDHAQSEKLVNWSLNSDDDLDDDQDDDDRLSWELTFIEGDSEIEVELDAITGEVIDKDDDDLDDDDRDDMMDDRDDDADDRHYYRQFYSDYSGSRPRVNDNNYYFGDDDDWDDDDWDDDDWDDDDWDDDDWDDDDWDDDDWDDDDWDDDDWDDDDWDDDDWDDDDWDDDDWDDDDWDD